MRMMPRGFGPPVFALYEALDTNHDGSLSSEEIKTATESLKKLDKDGDGKLSAEEIGWPPRRPSGIPGEPGGPGGPFGAEVGTSSFAERLMNRDANGDGEVTAKELPKSMRLLVPLCDINKDDAINRSEAEQLEQRLRTCFEIQY